MSTPVNFPHLSELGKASAYSAYYNAEKLFPISRQPKRQDLQIGTHLPFTGYDIWNHYEVSWLNLKGKPVVAMARIIYDCGSENIIESKSLKLYFNSFNNTQFKDRNCVEKFIQEDLALRLKAKFLSVVLIPSWEWKEELLVHNMSGICLDEQDISCSVYEVDPNLLTTEPNAISETVYSHLLKSNCLVTHQPDWCSVQITYTGNKINHASLLRYLVSYRNANEFHEHCIEKIFMHLLRGCNPQQLTVYGRSTRRGGIDINAFRSTQSVDPSSITNARLSRQ